VSVAAQPGDDEWRNAEMTSTDHIGDRNATAKTEFDNIFENVTALYRAMFKQTF